MALSFPILFLLACLFIPRVIFTNPTKFLAATNTVDLVISTDLFFFLPRLSTSFINAYTPQVIFALGFFEAGVPVPLFFPAWFAAKTVPSISDLLPITDAQTLRLLAFLEDGLVPLLLLPPPLFMEVTAARRRSFRCSQSEGAVDAIAQEGGGLNNVMDFPRRNRVSLCPRTYYMATSDCL